jgi:monovalent cation:H+ antiporter-2, CPA2 family
MHDLDLILTLTGGLAAALICGYITFRLGLSPIVGYLLAGVVVGSHTPGFVADREIAEQLAEIGVILLMFGVGLQFHLEELLAVGRIAVPGALGGSLAATVLGTLAGMLSGWGWSASIVFGLAISMSSTVVLMRVLADGGDLHTPTLLQEAVDDLDRVRRLDSQAGVTVGAPDGVERVNHPTQTGERLPGGELPREG